LSPEENAFAPNGGSVAPMLIRTIAPRKIATLAAVAACGFAAAAVPGAAPANSSCHSVTVKTKKRVFVYQRIAPRNRLSCGTARRLIRDWRLPSQFPQDRFGWFCEMKTSRKLCSMGNGNAPYFTFRVRTRRR
jgi:hypothetical protein